jgi:hypothetical protein
VHPGRRAGGETRAVCARSGRAGGGAGGEEEAGDTAWPAPSEGGPDRRIRGRPTFSFYGGSARGIVNDMSALVHVHVGAVGLCAAAATLLTACSTPASRIDRNPAVFATFPPAVQENVRKGIVEVGYTTDMVFIAKGEPKRKYQRRTAEGTFDVWSYVGTEYWTDRQRVMGSYHVQDASGKTRTLHDSVWVDVRQEREYEKMRIEFRDGVVTALERIMP